MGGGKGCNFFLSLPSSALRGHSLNFTICKHISSKISYIFLPFCFCGQYVPASLKCEPFCLLSQFRIPLPFQELHSYGEFLSQIAIAGLFSVSYNLFSHTHTFPLIPFLCFLYGKASQELSALVISISSPPVHTSALQLDFPSHNSTIFKLGSQTHSCCQIHWSCLSPLLLILISSLSL